MAHILPELGKNLHKHRLHAHTFFHLCHRVPWPPGFCGTFHWSVSLIHDLLQKHWLIYLLLGQSMEDIALWGPTERQSHLGVTFLPFLVPDRDWLIIYLYSNTLICVSCVSFQTPYQITLRYSCIRETTQNFKIVQIVALYH